jgi:hypothetical protein
MADATLRAAEALYAFGLARREVASPNYDWKSSFHRIKRLRNEAALVLHHDAITGTSRTTVVRDYLQRLTQGSNEVQQVSTDMLQLLLKANLQNHEAAVPFAFTAALYSLDVVQLKADFPQVYPIVVQNPLAWERHDVISVSIALLTDKQSSSIKGLQVVDQNGTPVRAQIFATMSADNVHTPNPTTNVRLYVEVRIPAMGVATYYLKRASKKDRLEKNNLVEHVVTELVEVERASGRVTSKGAAGKLRGTSAQGGGDDIVYRRQSEWFSAPSQASTDVHKSSNNNNDEGASQIILETARLSVQFQKHSGSIQSIYKKDGTTKMTSKVSQAWMRYTSSRSGAYLFRPHGTATQSRGESDRVTIALIRGKLVQQVRYYASHAQQVTTVYNIKGPMGDVVHAEPSSTADMNEEVVLRFNTDIASGGTFYTDNGAELMKRQHDSSKPIPVRNLNVCCLLACLFLCCSPNSFLFFVFCFLPFTFFYFFFFEYRPIFTQ